jgi:signal transduction protein with GAF and PtsI domain
MESAAMATTDLPDVEEVAAKVHEAWMNAKRARGVTTRTSETGEELMVPYEQLSEEAKELDRSSVRAVYDAIRSIKNE